MSAKKTENNIREDNNQSRDAQEKRIDKQNSQNDKIQGLKANEADAGLSKNIENLKQNEEKKITSKKPLIEEDMHVSKSKKAELNDKELDEDDEEDEDEEEKWREEQKREYKKQKELEKQRKKEEADYKKDILNAKREPYKVPIFIRLINILLGSLIIGMIYYSQSNQELTSLIITFIFTGILIVFGFIRLVNTFFEKVASGWHRLFNFFVGSILIITGITIYFIPNLGVQMTLLILSFAIILQGIARVLSGIFKGYLPMWYRFSTMLIGVSSVIIPSFVFYSIYLEEYEELNTLLLIALILGLNAIGRILKGLVGLEERKKKIKYMEQ
ncbi:MAG: ABC transporter permease [Candidatus Heimdallarchaeota archaeon]|nr:ABC transporter permease [Candidatus Heimdallarchaeota archaeon]